MKNIKVIKNKEEYLDSIKSLELLLSKNPEPNSAEYDKLDLLSQLIEVYEGENYKDELPTAIEAIKFRMEQLDLKQSDLADFIGSKSKVSEVLSGKIPLSIKMIRSLEGNLGIPAKVLIQEPLKSDEDFFKGWGIKTINELKKRNFSNHGDEENKIDLYNELRLVFEGNGERMATLFRQTNYRINPTTNRQALAGWLACVLKKNNEINNPNKFNSSKIDLKFMQDIAQISFLEDAPLMAKEMLKKAGINLIIEPVFPETKLDGAAIMNKDNPIIALTLRFDRLDNFWFTLMHEIAHISLHYSESEIVFYDELDEIKGIEIEIKEKEADNLAAEALIPASKWETSIAKIMPSKMSAVAFAGELKIHPAIVAGKIRHESGNYAKLTKIITDSKVRYFFEE